MNDQKIIWQNLDQLKYGPEEENYFLTWFENFNGTAFGMKMIEFRTVGKMTSIGFVGQRNKMLRGGFSIKTENLKEICRKFLEAT